MFHSLATRAPSPRQRGRDRSIARRVAPRGGAACDRRGAVLAEYSGSRARRRGGLDGIERAPRPWVSAIAYPGADDFDSGPPDFLDEDAAACFVSEILELILSMYSWVIEAIFDV